MIYSDKQYEVSIRELAKLKDALETTQSGETENKSVERIGIEALKSQIAEIEADVTHYDLLKSGKINHAKSFSLEALPSVLIEARIASGLSQTELAHALGVKPQQVQRDEASGYMGASFKRLLKVSRLLNVNTVGLFKTKPEQSGVVFSWKNVDDLVWEQLPVKVMAKRRWFDVPRGANLVETAKSYFLKFAGTQFTTALHRKKVSGETLPNEYALLAWQARILERTKTQIIEDKVPPFSLDDRWLSDLVKLTRREDGPKRARKLLAGKGIVLVIEKHLPGTYLDGAAMLSDTDNPVIGMTLRYDRLDNFWFVLFHELGHVFLHLSSGLHYDFFDEEGEGSEDAIEKEADKFALETLIPDDAWEQCLSRFALSDDSVRMDAERLGIDVSILAGRIRKEQNDYTILSDLVGQDCVSAQFVGGDDDLGRE
ncbi:MAG: helix-turn-helix domain-containing protein [Gammaproteobacteria bacterium]